MPSEPHRRSFRCQNRPSATLTRLRRLLPLAADTRTRQFPAASPSTTRTLITITPRPKAGRRACWTTIDAIPRRDRVRQHGRLAKAGKGHKESWAAVRHTYYDTLDHKQTQRDDDELMFAILFVYRHAFWDFSNKDVYGVKMAEAAAPMITPEESRVAAEAMVEKGIAEQAAKRAKRRASRAEAATARAHADFPACKQCGSGIADHRRRWRVPRWRSCDARRMARSQMAADAARERVKVKRQAKRMQDGSKLGQNPPARG